MKKLYLLLVVAVSLLAATPASAQVSFGVKGGLNVTDMKLSEDVFDASNQAGWFIGPTIKVALPLTGLSVDGSALYDYRSAKVKVGNASEEETIKQQQIAIPVNLRYGIGLGSMASVFAFAGPQWGINVGDKDFDWASGSSYSLKKSNFSVNVGLGASIAKHLQITANYNIACGKTADVSLTKVAEQVSKSKSRNSSWQIGLAYFF